MKKIFIFILHFGYWFLYALVCLLVLAGIVPKVFPSQNVFQRVFGSFFGVIILVPSILSFYGFYFWVFKFIKLPIKIFSLLGSILLILLGSALFGLTILPFIDSRITPTGLEGCVFLVVIMCILGLIHGILGAVIRGFIAWYENTKITQELSEKNFEMEMALVKSKLDPHFLFNSINNIDILIGKDAVKASAFLNKLSDIMRFMLYETKTESIPLEKEWEYLEKYVELQKIRSANPNFVEYGREGDFQNAMIAPMSLIPFVENAFKHGEKVKADQSIVFHLEVKSDVVFFTCKNKYLPHFQSEDDYNGLGNELIKRRLALLYPEKHRLEIDDNGEVYEVRLEIKNM